MSLINALDRVGTGLKNTVIKQSMSIYQNVGLAMGKDPAKIMDSKMIKHGLENIQETTGNYTQRKLSRKALNDQAREAIKAGKTIEKEATEETKENIIEKAKKKIPKSKDISTDTANISEDINGQVQMVFDESGNFSGYQEAENISEDIAKGGFWDKAMQFASVHPAATAAGLVGTGVVVGNLFDKD